MQLYHSTIVRLADVCHDVTKDSGRALRWLAKHADRADPAVVIEASIHMAGREKREIARNRFLEIFKEKEKTIATKEPLMAAYYIARARESSSAVRDYASGLWNSLHPTRPMPGYDKLSCI